jgi:transposase-like protein
MKWVHCSSERVVKNGTKTLKSQEVLQRYLCQNCNRRFNERSGTAMAGLRTPVVTVEMAVKARHEGLGVRATARVVGKSASCITAWEGRLSQQLTNWSPNAPDGGTVTMEGDELYTCVGENLLPRSL